MFQERLSSLRINNINYQIFKEISYDDVIDIFAARKNRRINF